MSVRVETRLPEGSLRLMLFGDGEIGIDFFEGDENTQGVVLTRLQARDLAYGIIGILVGASEAIVEANPVPEPNLEPEAEFTPCKFQGPGAYRLRNGQQVILDEVRRCQEADGIQDSDGDVETWQWELSGEIKPAHWFMDCELAEFLSPLPELPDGYEFTEPKQYRAIQFGDIYRSRDSVVALRCEEVDIENSGSFLRWIVKEKATAESPGDRWQKIGEQIKAIAKEFGE